MVLLTVLILPLPHFPKNLYVYQHEPGLVLGMNPARLAVNSLQYQSCCHSITDSVCEVLGTGYELWYTGNQTRLL